MRPFLVPGTLVLLVAGVGPVFAQSGPDIRYVNVEVAEVRAGPSDKPEFYVTNRLQRGQPVEVVGEEPGGWLAIRPPEGSFSYVNTRFLHHMYPSLPNHVVKLEGIKVPVFIGSQVMNDRRPTIRSVELEPGAQVTSVGKPLTDQDGTWMPIEAPARERRYLRASQTVRKQITPGSSDVTRSAASPAGGVASANNGSGTNSLEDLYRQAEHADRIGQVNEAVRLYLLFVIQADGRQPLLSARALSRAQFLQGGYQNYGAGVGVVPPPAQLMNMPSQGRTYPLATATSNNGVQLGAPIPPRRAAGYSAEVRRAPAPIAPDTTPLPLQRAPAPVHRMPAPPRGTASSWMGYRGVLVKAGRVVEGQATYALWDPQTLRPLLYATPGAGVQLDGYINQVVDLWGYTVYRGDLKNNYMIVSQIRHDR